MQWNETIVTSNFSVHTINHKGKSYYWNEYKNGESRLSDFDLGKAYNIGTKEDVEKYIIENED